MPFFYDQNRLLEKASICCLSLRKNKNMNLRKSVRHCKENDRLLLKNLSSERKKKEVLKSKKKSKEAFPETPRKYDSNTELGGFNRMTEMVSSIATSTPITSTVKQKGLRSSFQLELAKTRPCAVTLTPIKILKKYTNSDQVSLHKKKSVSKKVSQMSLVIPIQPLNRTINCTRMNKSNISNMTLRSHHSQNSYPESSFSTSSLSQYSSHEEPVHIAKTARSLGQSSNGSSMKLRSRYSSNENQIVLTRVKSLSKSTGSQYGTSHVHCNEASEKPSKHGRQSSASVNKDTNLSSKKSSSLNLRSLRSKEDSAHESSSSHELTSSSFQYLPNKKQVMTKAQSLRKSTSSQDGASHAQSSKQKNKKPAKRKVQEPDQLKTPARYNTFSGNIPIDDLILGWKGSCARKTKSESSKLPRKNTLKRKRIMIDALKKADEGYEDDIYECKDFDQFKDLLQDSDDSDVSFGMPTPKGGFEITPMVRHKTPKFRDCFSPTEFAVARKAAEEYMYNRNKKRKSTTQSESPVITEKRKLEFSQVIEDAEKMQRSVERMVENESDDDSYFSVD